MHKLFRSLDIAKLLLLLVVGFPGVSKIIFAFIIKYYGGIELIGVYANDLNVASIIGTVPALGFSAVLMNRIPNSDGFNKKIIFGKVLALTFIVIAVSIPLIVFLKKLDIIIDLKAVVVYLTGFSLYQLVRHNLIAEKKYLNIIILESLIVIVVTSAFLFQVDNPLFYHGVALLSIFGVVIIPLVKFNKHSVQCLSEFKSGMGFGFSNLSSSFLALLSVPLANQLLGVIYAGMLGIINPIINVALLIPRSLSSYYIPLLVKLKKYSREQFALFDVFFRRNWLFLTIICLFILGGWISFLLFENGSEWSIRDSFFIVGIIVFYTYITQISLPFYSLMNAWDNSKVSFVSNLVVLISFLFYSFLLSQFGKKVQNVVLFELYYVGLIILYFGRFLWLRRIVYKEKIKHE